MLLLNKNKVIKRFTFALKSYSGKNASGRTTVFHRIKGHKRRYRFVDFFRKIRNVVGKVRTIEYDPNRSSFVALVCYKNSVLSYALASDTAKVGDFFLNSFDLSSIKNFNSTNLGSIPVGSYIYNLEIFPNFGGKFFRSAGSYGQILKKISEEYVLIRMRSKEIRLLHSFCFSTIGVVSNKFRKFEKLYKASQSFYKGIRPIVRGEAKNPIDHPHGGNTSGGRPQMSPWGKLTHGVRTRHPNKISSRFIFKSRHQAVTR